MSEEFRGCPHQGRKGERLDIAGSKIGFYFFQCLEGLKLIFYFPLNQNYKTPLKFCKGELFNRLPRSIVCLVLTKSTILKEQKSCFLGKYKKTFVLNLFQTQSRLSFLQKLKFFQEYSKLFFLCRGRTEVIPSYNIFDHDRVKYFKFYRPPSFREKWSYCPFSHIVELNQLEKSVATP